MLFILHHSKGALMLSAGEREQVLRWSERQLGKKAGLISITEGICTEAVNAVERDGTGIGLGSDIGCQPVMGMMANMAQDVPREQGSSDRYFSAVTEPRPEARSPTWH